MEALPLDTAETKPQGLLERARSAVDSLRVRRICDIVRSLNEGNIQEGVTIKSDQAGNSALSVIDFPYVSNDLQQLTNINITWDGDYGSIVQPTITARRNVFDSDGYESEERFFDSSAPKDHNTMTLAEVYQTVRRVQKQQVRYLYC